MKENKTITTKNGKEIVVKAEIRNRCIKVTSSPFKKPIRK